MSSRIVHALPDWKSRQRLPGQGVWKDAMGRLRLWDELGLDVDVVDMDTARPESLLEALGDDVTDLVFEYGTWPEVLEAARALWPRLRIHVRVFHAEALERWQRRHREPNGLAGLARLAHAIYQVARRDARMKRVADSILGVSAWDNRRYWKRLPGRARVLDVPYFCPWPDLGRPRRIDPWEGRRDEVACVTAGLGPIEEDLVGNFGRFAAAARRLDVGQNLRFVLANPFATDHLDDVIRSGFDSVDEVNDTWPLLAEVKAVAVLTDLGFGARTAIFDALEAGCHVLVSPGLAGRLPRGVREVCVVLDSLQGGDIAKALDAIHRPPSPTDTNAPLREAARAALVCLFGGERGPVDIGRGPSAVEDRAAGTGPSVIVEPGLGFTVWRRGKPGSVGFLPSIAPRAGTAILMYHGIIDKRRDDVLDRFALSASMLRSHMRLMKRSRDIVPLSVLLDCLAAGHSPDPHWVVITMDDALRSQVTRGAEVLDAERVPWSLCVPAALAGTNRSIWSYELAFLVLECWEKPEIPLPNGGSTAISTRARRERALRSIRRGLPPAMNGVDPAEYVERLVADYGRDRFVSRLLEDGRFRLASWDEIRALHATGVEVLSHGFRHLPQEEGLLEVQREEELVKARAVLCREVGSCDALALPHGVSASWTQERAGLAGYRAALSARPSFVTRGARMLDLPRFDADIDLEKLEEALGIGPLAQ